MKTLKEALEGLLWLIDQGQLIEKEPSVCAPLLVNDARGALIESIIAERLSKIEVLEELLNDSRLCDENYFSIIQEYIAELKAGK